MKNLKKILSVLALIVLVGSDFLTSISYALEDGLEDSVVIQTESEEEMENVENEEGNVDEEDSEDAYEDESIEEEELETENLTLDIVESTTGGIVEEGTGEVSEIGSGEVEELTEETVEGVTGDIAEELTWDVEELTGTVDENTETGEDIVFEDITYNEAPIIGEKTYNDVTVRVEALTGIFPEGTDLTIEPIKWGDLSVLKDKLVDEQEEVKEDTTVVAFDITFRYEGEEVQPKEGEKVKVTFDYSKNENLLEADKNENQEVKVYHIEDMDNNGKKINQGEEVVKDVTNKVESEEEGIAVVDAESFSIYAVVTTTGNPDSVTVTHYLNGGYWMEDHSTESKPIVYTCINNSCTTTTHYKTPSKDGYMFMGWIDGSGNRRKYGVATDGMSVYAKWQEFGDLNVYILGSDNDSDKHQYTLMDRNMGALDIYNKSGTINDESRGYYYQWGNNYGFDSHYENSGALSETTKQKVDVANYSWEFPYYGYKFYLNGAKEYANWMSGSVNKSLWGDGNITSKEAKQGPCPAGYYIPSKNDWQGLLVSWNSVNSRAEKNFYFDFLVPSAGIRDRGYQQGNGSKVVDIERYRYASSSRNNNDTKTKAVITLTQTEMDKVPIVSPSSNNNDRSHERGSNGLSVRCFKNVTGSIINISDIDLNGGQKAIISIDSGKVVSLQNPVRNSDEFRGWYTTSNFSGNPIGVGSGLSVGDKLYARRCADGLVDDGTQCIDGYSITFDSNGGSPVATQTVSPLGTGTRPTDPTKMGYVFTGWFLTGAIEEFDFTGTQITGNITLYAHWNTGESYFKINCNKKKLDVDNNQLLDKSDPYLTGIVITGATDSEIILANYSNRCNLAGYEYTGAMVYGSDDGSGSKLSTTTLLADGTRVIEMYFQPVKNQFTLNSADYTSTVGSSQNGLYYYGAKVTLSGDSSDDCFEWDEWNGLPEGTTNSAQTSFSMPNDSVTVTPSVKENTYNIIFSGNGSSSGEMSSINEVKCTESIQLTPNAFGKTGYTFTGWSRASGENTREYSDGQTVSGLSKTNLDNVTLYAVWDINKYIVTGSVAAGQENMGYLSGSTSTGASLTGLYEYGKELVFIAVPEIGYLFDYWKNGDTILSGTDLGDGTNQLTVVVNQILDIVAHFTANEKNVTINYYEMNTGGLYPNDPYDTDSLTGLVGQTKSINPESRIGFHLDIYRSNTGVTISENSEDNVINVYYERERYFIERSGRYYQMPDATYIDFVKITPDNQPYYQYYYGEEVRIESIHPAYGWIFSGWYDATSEGKGFPSDEVSLDSRDLTFHMPNHDVWVEPIMEHIPYILSFTGYEGAEITNLESCSYGTGDRETYYDYSECLPNLNKEGYWFNGWDDENGSWVRRYNEYSPDPILNRMPAHDYKLVANFEPRKNMSYEKYYYLQDIEGTGYTLSGDLTDGGNDGITNQEMPGREPLHNIEGFQYSGFGYSGIMLPGDQWPYIKATGDNYINYYYDRKVYLVNVNYDNKIMSITGAGEYRYETPVTLTATANTGYSFSGFTSYQGELLSSSSVYNFTMPDSFVDIYADANPIEYSIEYEPNGGELDPYSSYANYTVESSDLSIGNPYKDGYKFLGWTGGVVSGGIEGEEDIVEPTRDLIIAGGSIGDRKYYANWEPDEVKVTVNYYLKKIDSENNTLIDEVDVYLAGVEYTGLSDDIVNIFSRYGTGIEGYHYDHATVFSGSSEEIATETTVLPDGSREINMYYIPNKYNFTLNSDSYSSTEGSSESTGYYYGAIVRLSGDSDNDCYSWSGWTINGIRLSDSTSHQTWFAMPANDVDVTPSTTEKTYNIIFNGNGSTLGEMSSMNGVRCTESIGLTLNSFGKKGYTFTGWSRTSGGSRDYVDGATVVRLSTGVDVNLYAVWDVNHYTVTFDLNGGNLTGDMTETKDYTIETLEITLDDYIPVRSGYIFTGWYKSGTLVNHIAGGEIGDYTLTAKWEADNQAVFVFDYLERLEGGYNVIWNQPVLAKVDSFFEAPIKLYTGFDFDETNPENITGRVVSWDPGQNELKVFYKRVPYPVVVRNVGERISSVTTGGGDYLYEEQVTVNIMPFTGWEFLNWTLIKGSLDGVDLNQQTLSFSMPAEEIQISPNLDHIPYTVSFDTASGTTVENQTYYYDDILSGLNSAITTRTGYNFDGWYLSGVLYTSGSTMPAENITLTAKWAPCTGIQYQVNHRGENTGDNNYEVLLSGYIMYGTSDTQTIAKSEEFAGFTLSGNVEQKAINPNGTTEVNIYYNRNVYTISLDNNGGTGVSEITGKYQSAIAKPDDPNRLGYNFAGWDPSIPDTMPVNGGESTAKWNPGLTQYTVNYHIEKVQTGEYDIYTGVYAGETDSSPWIPLLNPSLTGFITPAQFTGKIIPGGTEFDYYYDRDSYMLYYDTAGGTPIPGKSFRYGEKILTGETQRSGYTLIKWNNIPEDGNMPAQSGLTLVALREPDAHTKYTVYHYFESLSGGYVTGNVQPLSGTTDTLTTARPINVPGYKTDFDIGDEEHTGGQVNIDGDGNAYVEIYYDRIVYQIAFDMNGGDAIQGTGVKFGTYIKSFIDSLNPHKKGYAFSGWNPEFPTAMPDRNLTGIAMWTPATGEYKVEFYYQRADGTYSSTATREELRTGKTEWVGRVKNSDKEPSIAGYAFDSENPGNVLEGQIVGDGSLVLKLYFKKQFTVRYLTGLHGTFSEDVHSNLDYGVGTPVFRGSTGSHDSGYTFLGWDPELTGVVVEDRDYIAQWKADSDTEFKVEYYLQNVEDDGYTFAETGLQTGTTNTTGYADTMKEFTGFIFSGGNQNNVTSGLIAGDGSLVLKLYYDRKEYNVTTGEVEHGTMEGGAGSQRYGKRIIFTAHPDAGYLISKWLRDGNEILSGGVIWTGEELEVEVDTGMEISVEFEARNDTPYYVDYYKENLGGGYDIWTGTYSGTTDQEAVAQELSFTGFTYDSGDERNERTGNIDGDGSRVLRLYYTRNTNNVVYVYTGKVPSGQVVPETTGYKYEATVIVAEVPNVLGYNFSWSTGVSSFTMPDEKVVITGTWTANTGTKYAVQHMLQNIEDDGYTQTGEDQILSGETDELTNAQANNYTGFTVQSFSQTGIKGDESTIVVIKYDRNEYEVTTGEVEHGTMEGGVGSQRYGKRIIFTAHPDAGYVISKWLRDGNEILSGGVIWTGEELEIKVDTGMEISVEFKAKEDTPYYVEYYKEKLGGGYDVWTGTYSGTTDQEAVAQELSFTGFTFSGGNQSNITSGVIAGDGSLVLKLFYDRNKYTITWKDGNDEVLKTDQLFYGALPEYTGEMPTKTATAQYSYTFNNTWTPAIEIVTTGVTYTAQFDVEVNKYLITFVDGDGKIVQSGMVVYGEMPQYTGTTPTKTATAQYSYTFNNTWTPAMELVTTGVTYTAQFDSTVNEYTISIVPSDTDMGTVSPSEINLSYGSTIVESGNIITVGGVEVKATPKSADVQYTYEFDSWTNTCGSELIGTCTIQANFRKILNKYSITWMNDDGSLIDTTMVGYGVIPIHAKPTKTETEEYRYVFVGWDPEVVAVVGDAEYTAVFNAEEKEQTSKGGNMSGGGGRRSGIDNAENSDNQHGSAEENSNLFTGDYYVSSGNVDEETLSLYEWARENEITTMDTLEYANPDGLLTRGHMAKMVVNFAQNVLGKTIPTEYPDKCNWKDKESERESSEIKEYAKKACALGLMGIYVEKFMPNKVLDRAEFGTIISRLLWGDKYNVIDTDHRGYYEDHLGALKKHGILSQTDNPEERRELRKWVWLVFRRISEKLKK